MTESSYYTRMKGPRQLDYLKLTGKFAERLIEEYSESHGMVADIAKPDRQEVVVHSFVLRPGRSARLQVPADLSRHEAERLIKFIEILPTE